MTKIRKIYKEYFLSEIEERTMSPSSQRTKLYQALYTYQSKLEGDIFHTDRNIWVVAGENKREARKAFWKDQKRIERGLNRDAPSIRTLESLDALWEIKVPGYQITVEEAQHR